MLRYIKESLKGSMICSCIIIYGRIITLFNKDWAFFLMIFDALKSFNLKFQQIITLRIFKGTCNLKIHVIVLCHYITLPCLRIHIALDGIAEGETKLNTAYFVFLGFGSLNYLSWLWMRPSADLRRFHS